MSTARRKGRLAAMAVVVGAAIALAGCASSNPLDSGSTTPAAGGDSDSAAIVIGSQAYYSNEIIAEIYAEALENAGFTVTRQFNIGAREVYLPSIEKGDIDLFPEYTGDLLQALDSTTTAKTTDDVYAALPAALPDGLRVLDQADAADENSYVVTQKYSDDNKVTSLADLANLPSFNLGGNAEMETRPYGVQGLKDTYGVTANFVTIADSGGEVTVQSLNDGTIDVGNIYTGDPNVKTNKLVVLKDPKGLFLASHVVPLASDKVTDDMAAVINKVQAALTEDVLLDLDSQSVNDQKSPEDIAAGFISDNGL